MSINIMGMNTNLDVFVLVMMLLIGSTTCVRNINIGLLLTRQDLDLNSLQSSIDVINATNGVILNVTKFPIKSGSLLKHSIRCNQLTDGLSHVAFILEPYKVDPISCVMSEILNKPHITLSHEHRAQCRNVISLRPEPEQLNQALIAMIKEHQPREVAVVIEEGLGETAADIMSHDHLVNKLFFQIIGTVDFTQPITIGRIVDDLRASGITKVLLVVQGDNVEALMREVRFRGLSRADFSWYLPYADFSKFRERAIFEGIYGLQLPEDNDLLNETYCELRDLEAMRLSNRKGIDPLLHDAFEVIANAGEEFKIKCSPANRQKDTRRCKVKRQGDKCSSIVDFIKRVLVQRGITGDVKFTVSGYRNITSLSVKEISDGEELQLGSWSTNCETFIWNPGTTYAEQKQQGQCQSTKTDAGDDDNQLIAFKPRKRRLKVVTYIEEPFMMLYNDSVRKGNDQFYGFLKDLLDRLKNDLDFEYVLHVVSDSLYGVIQKDGSWNGMIGELIDKKADIAAAPMTITSSRQQVVEFTKPYMDFSMALIMEKPKGKTLDLFAFLKPFHPNVWVSLIAVTLITAVLIFLIDKYSLRGYRRFAMEGKGDAKGDEFRLGNSVWFVGSTLLQQGAELTPMSVPGRIMGATFWFYALIMISTYTANLAAVFATTKIESKINSLEDLAGQEEIQYGVLSSGTTYDFFRESTIPLYKTMFQTMNRHSSFGKSTTSAVTRVRKGGYAYLTDGPVLVYKHQRKPCNTFLIKNLLMAKGYGLGLQLNSEWTQLISVRILKLKEEGFIEQLRLKYWDERSQCVPDGAKKKGTPTSLDLYSMAGVYIVLAVGTGIAFFVLFLENKASSWLRGRCFGCFAKEEVFFKNSQREKATNQAMLTYMDFPDNGQNFAMNNANSKRQRREPHADSPRSTESGRYHDVAANYRHARNAQFHQQTHDRESTL